MVYTKTQCFYSYDHNCELSTSHFLKKETVFPLCKLNFQCFSRFSSINQ